MRSKLACVLANCGFKEAIDECRMPGQSNSMVVDQIVQAVLKNIQSR